MKITVRVYNEFREIEVKTGLIKRNYDNGEVYEGSSQWLCTGVTILTRFGQYSYTLSLSEFYDELKRDKDSLFYKNGKAKFRLNDLDHGTKRQWGNQFTQDDVTIQ